MPAEAIRYVNNVPTFLYGGPRYCLFSIGQRVFYSGHLSGIAGHAFTTRP